MALQDPQTILAAVLHRLGQAEARIAKLEAAEVRGDDWRDIEREARRVAGRVGLSLDVVTKGPADQRKHLACALRIEGWSYQKIAHVMGCSERTIERYFAPPAKPHRD